MTDKLSIKHQAFCEAYLKCFNATKAYMEIYPDSTYDAARSSATDLLANPSVKEYLSKRMSDLIMTSTEVLLGLADIARNGEKQVDRIRAYELIGKSQALFLDRTDITTKGDRLSWNEFISPKEEPKITVVE